MCKTIYSISGPSHTTQIVFIIRRMRDKYMSEIKNTNGNPSKKTLEASLKEKDKRIKELEEVNLILKRLPFSN